MIALADRVPRYQHAQWREECGEHDQPHGDAVDAHVVVDVGIGDPNPIHFVLESSLGAMEVARQVQGQHQGQ